MVDAGKPSYFEANTGKEGEWKFKESSFTDKVGVQRTNRTIYSPLPPRGQQTQRTAPQDNSKFDAIMDALRELREEVASLDVLRAGRPKNNTPF